MNVDYSSLDYWNGKLNCDGSTNDEHIHAVRLVIWDRQVQQLTLISNHLQEDALLLYWGAPDAFSTKTYPNERSNLPLLALGTQHLLRTRDRHAGWDNRWRSHPHHQLLTFHNCMCR